MIISSEILAKCLDLGLDPESVDILCDNGLHEARICIYCIGSDLVAETPSGAAIWEGTVEWERLPPVLRNRAQMALQEERKPFYTYLDETIEGHSEVLYGDSIEEVQTKLPLDYTGPRLKVYNKSGFVKGYVGEDDFMEFST